MTSHRAPRFHAYFSHLEGRPVMLLPRVEWEELLGELDANELVEIDLSGTPIAGVTRDSRVEAVVAVRESRNEVVIDVYRNDPKDAPTPINVDRYRVWEGLPPHRDFVSIVNESTTDDDANTRGFVETYVFLVKAVVDTGHWLAELPAKVRAVIERQSRAAQQ
jgi:hypothetical protein